MKGKNSVDNRWNRTGVIISMILILSSIIILLPNFDSVYGAPTPPPGSTPTDNIPPSGTITINEGDEYATSNVITITFTCTDNPGGSGCYQMMLVVRANDMVGVPGGEPALISYSNSLSTTLGYEGLFEYAVKFKDNAGNISTEVSDTIIWDQTPPELDFKMDGFTNAMYVTNDNTVILSLTCSDFLSGCSDVSIYFNGNIQTVVSANPLLTHELFLLEEETVIDISVEDSAGNSATVTKTVIQDLTPPIITAIPERDPDFDDWYTSPVTIDWQAEDELSGLDSCDESSITYSGPGGKDNVITVECSDLAGNTIEETFTLNYDATAPEIILPSSAEEESTDDPDTFIITYEVESFDEVDDNVEVECIPASGSIFLAGEVEVTCVARDDADNAETESFTIIVGSASAMLLVEDTEAPLITVDPGSPIIVDSSGLDGSPVTFAISAVDEIDGEVEVTCDYNSGDIFPIGTTIMLCEASDSSGNSAEEMITIIVEDTGNSGNEPPVASAGADITITEGMMIELDGSGSHDPDSNNLSFVWIQTSGPIVELSDNGLATTSFVAPQVSFDSEITFMLTVVDDNGALDSDFVTVVVHNTDSDDGIFEIRNSDPDSIEIGSENRLYKPGQQIVVDGQVGSNALAEIDEEGVMVQVVDNDGNIMSSGQVEVDSSGSYTIKFTLPEDVSRGQYTINVISNGSVKSSSNFIVATPLTFVVKAEGKSFEVETATNSAVQNFEFVQEEKKIAFEVQGESGTEGVATVTIPKELLSGDFMVTIDDVEIDPASMSIVSSTETETILEISYMHSIHQIEVIGTNVVPEFPVIMLIMSGTIGIVIFLSRIRDSLRRFS